MVNENEDKDFCLFSIVKILVAVTNKSVFFRVISIIS